MDLNQLLYQHQLALLNQQHGASLADQTAYRDLAGFYAARIRLARNSLGVAQYPRGARKG